MASSVQIGRGHLKFYRQVEDVKRSIADLMVMFLRFRALPDEQMKPIDDFLKRGKPLVAIRTSTHAFKFENKAGKTQFAKWMFVPVTGQEFIAEDKLATYAKVFLEDELKGRVSQIPVEFDMVLQLAQAGDPTNNATVAWPEDRQKVVAGRLKITAVTDKSSCDKINFNPLVLPTGIEGSDDPLLAARAGSYAVSQARRLSK